MAFLGLLIALALGAEPTLPQLQTTVPVDWPPELVAQGERVVVVLELAVDADGQVTDAAVVDAPDEGAGQAALLAIRSFRFSPATDARGNQVSSVIQYALALEPEEVAAVSVEGRIREAGIREPISDAEVRVVREGEVRLARTDADGMFRFVGLELGTWSVVFERAGFDVETVEVEVKDGRVVDVSLSPVRSRPWEDDVDEEITVVGRKVQPEVTERVLSYEELRYLPGTGGDIVKVVQNLPGVARPPFGIGQLIIRGTAPENSAYYLDGAQVPTVFHFAGFSTVLASDFVQEVAFLPGNYSVRYGRTLGGVVDLRTRDVLPERSSSYISVDLFQTAAYTEQLLGERDALILAGRRSYVDTILNPIFASIEGVNIQAPRYYDGQARWTHETANGMFDALILGSVDQFRVVGEDADGEEETAIGLGNWFAKARLRWVEGLGGGWENEASIIGGPENQSFQIAPNGEAYERPTRVALREEIRSTVSADQPLGARFGVDVQGGRFAFLYDVPAFGAREEFDATYLLPAAYGEATLRTGPLQTSLGLRWDGARYMTADQDPYTTRSTDPRIAVQLFPDSPSVFKVSYGQFSELPTPRQAAENPLLNTQRSLQTSVGWEQRWTPVFDTEISGFSNRLEDLVVGREDSFRFFSGPPPVGPLDTDPFANEGVGRIYGAEMLAKAQTDRTTAWLSTTVSRSLRTNRVEDEEALFTFDQPLVLTALFSHELPKRWRIGARFRYGTGNPYTPVVNRTFDLGRQQFVPVYGERDSERLRAFRQLDVRIDKDWVFKAWTLTAYLDLQNATSAQNVETIAWTFDFSEEDPTTGLPVLPAFGVRGEW